MLAWAKWISLVGIVFFYVVQAEWSQYIQTNEGLNKPFLLTWINHSSLSIYFVVAALYVKIYGAPKRTRDLHHGDAGDNGKVYSILNYLREYDFSLNKYVQQGIALGFLYLVPNALYFYAVGFGSSVGITTTIFNTNIATAYVFSVCLLGERATIKKSMALLLCIGGTFLVSVLAKPNQPISLDSIDLMTFAAAILFGLWEVLYKRFVVGENSPTLLLLFIYGSYGIAHLFLFWVFLWPLNQLRIEMFSLPSKDQIGLILVNMFLASMFNCSFFTALALLDSPVFVSIACLLTIPTTTLVDYIRFHKNLSSLEIVGGVMIIVGFLLFSVACGPKTDEHENASKKESPEMEGLHTQYEQI